MYRHCLQIKQTGEKWLTHLKTLHYFFIFLSNFISIPNSLEKKTSIHGVYVCKHFHIAGRKAQKAVFFLVDISVFSSMITPTASTHKY